MRYTPPTKITFYVSIVLVAIGVIFFFVPIFHYTSLILLLAGYGVLVYGVVSRGV